VGSVETLKAACPWEHVGTYFIPLANLSVSTRKAMDCLRLGTRPFDIIFLFVCDELQPAAALSSHGLTCHDHQHQNGLQIWACHDEGREMMIRMWDSLLVRVAFAGSGTHDESNTLELEV
jgi:hypothetical protein